MQARDEEQLQLKRTRLKQKEFAKAGRSKQHAAWALSIADAHSKAEAGHFYVRLMGQSHCGFVWRRD